MALIKLPAFVIDSLRKCLFHRAGLALIINIAARDYRQIFFGTCERYIQEPASLCIRLEPHLHLVDILLERMAPRNGIIIVIFSNKAVVSVKHNARQSILEFIRSARRYKNNEREFKTLTLMNGHGRYLVLACVSYFNISLFDMDLHLLKLIGNT